MSGVDSLESALERRDLRQHSDVIVGKGDFALRATVVIDEMSSRGAGISFDGGSVILDDREAGAVLAGRLFGGGKFPFETQRPTGARPGAPIEVEISRYDGSLAVKLNEVEMGRIGMNGFALGRVGFDLAAGNMRVLECSVEGDLSRFPLPRAAFSSADGDIDEHRDPSVASDGTKALVTAIAVQTTDDGKTRETLVGRFVEADGSMSAPFTIDLGGASVELAVTGFARGEARPWKLLVQGQGAKRVADNLTVFDSADGRSFAQASRIDASAAPLRLLTGAMTELDGALLASATSVRGGTPHATTIRFTPMDGWKVSELAEDPSCEPLWIGPDRTLIRKPSSLDREVRSAGSKFPASGLETGPTALGLIYAEGAVVRLAGAESGFPYPLQELVSRDRGETWTKARTVWGGSASNACSAKIAGGRVLIFEGGDKARREHVLVLRLTDADVNPPEIAPAAPVQPTQPTPKP